MPSTWHCIVGQFATDVLKLPRQAPDIALWVKLEPVCWSCHAEHLTLHCGSNCTRCVEAAMPSTWHCIVAQTAPGVLKLPCRAPDTALWVKLEPVCWSCHAEHLPLHCWSNWNQWVEAAMPSTCHCIVGQIATGVLKLPSRAPDIALWVKLELVCWSCHAEHLTLHCGSNSTGVLKLPCRAPDIALWVKMQPVCWNCHAEHLTLHCGSNCNRCVEAAMPINVIKNGNHIHYILFLLNGTYHHQLNKYLICLWVVANVFYFSKQAGFVIFWANITVETRIGFVNFGGQ